MAVAARTRAELPYADELADAGALLAPSREAHGIRPAGRLSADELLPLWEPGQTGCVCRSAAFAEALGTVLVERLGFAPSDVRIEPFGPSG